MIRKFGYKVTLLSAIFFQTLGLLLCLSARENLLFVIVRAIQGFGEGTITVGIFTGYSLFIPDERSRARAIASFSFAWLAVSFVTPLAYKVLPNGAGQPWRSIFGMLIVLSVISFGFIAVGIGRQSAYSEKLSLDNRGLLTLGVCAICLGILCQGVPLWPTWWQYASLIPWTFAALFITRLVLRGKMTIVPEDSAKLRNVLFN